jgi:chromosome segregation ATPase
MTDIVVNLRSLALTSDGWARLVCAEAAEENERLRNIIDTVHPQMQATIDRLTKDNADLSEACADGWGQARKRQDQVRNLEAELQDWKAAYHADTKRIEAERDRLRGEVDRAVNEIDELGSEIVRLRAGLMRVLQYENKCDQTGQSCDGPRGCACSREAETWCDGDGT